MEYKMRKTFTKLLPIAAALGLAVACVGFGTPQKASADFSVCTGGNFCLWTSTNGGGSVYFAPTSMTVNQCISLPVPYDNNVESLYDNTLSRDFTIYTGSACSGTANLIVHGQQFKTLPSPYNNNISSIRRSR